MNPYSSQGTTHASYMHTVQPRHHSPASMYSFRNVSVKSSAESMTKFLCWHKIWVSALTHWLEKLLSEKLWHQQLSLFNQTHLHTSSATLYSSFERERLWNLMVRHKSTQSINLRIKCSFHLRILRVWFVFDKKYTCTLKLGSKSITRLSGSLLSWFR
jgi:hypothetical protein